MSSWKRPGAKSISRLHFRHSQRIIVISFPFVAPSQGSGSGVTISYTGRRQFALKLFVTTRPGVILFCVLLVHFVKGFVKIAEQFFDDGIGIGFTYSDALGQLPECRYRISSFEQ